MYRIFEKYGLEIANSKEKEARFMVKITVGIDAMAWMFFPIMLRIF